MVHLAKLTALAFAIVGVSAESADTDRPKIHFSLQRFTADNCPKDHRVGDVEHLKDWNDCKEFDDNPPEGPYHSFTVHTNEVKALDEYDCKFIAFKDKDCKTDGFTVGGQSSILFSSIY